MHFTLHVAKYPIQVGILAIALLAVYGLVKQKAGPRVRLFPVKGQHVTSHT